MFVDRRAEFKRQRRLAKLAIYKRLGRSHLRTQAMAFRFIAWDLASGQLRLACAAMRQFSDAMRRANTWTHFDSAALQRMRNQILSRAGAIRVTPRERRLWDLWDRRDEFEDRFEQYKARMQAQARQR